MKINFFQLFQKTLRKTLDKETKINYNKENETGRKENTPCKFVLQRLILVCIGLMAINIIPLNSTKVKIKEVFCLEKLYSCEQVADRYGVKVETVWAWIREKRLPAVKIGKGYRVKESDLATFEQQNNTATE